MSTLQEVGRPASQAMKANSLKSVGQPHLSFGDYMEEKLAQLLERIEKSEPYSRVFDVNAQPRFILTVTKYVLLEVFSYGPHVTEATFTAIGRMPKNRPELMKIMVKHDLEEVDHGEMALVDFVKLGGNEAWARQRRITPASLAMAATVRMLSERESPFCYLGYMYPFEGLTPLLTVRLLDQLSSKGLAVSEQRFINVHAAEDIAHAKLLKKLIGQVTQEFEDAAGAIEYGFDCFSAVYPIPIWESAMALAMAELEG